MMPLFVLLLLMSFTFSLNAQEDIQVVSFGLDEADSTAIVPKTAVIDAYNGKHCALIKVHTNESGLAFDVGILGVVKVVSFSEAHPDEIWVYVPEGVKRITISHPYLKPLKDFALGSSLQSGKTYQLKLKLKELPKTYGALAVTAHASNESTSVTEDLPECKVFVDGKEMGYAPIVLNDLPVGLHRVRVCKDGFADEHRSVLISQESPTLLSFSMSKERDFTIEICDHPDELAQLPGRIEECNEWLEKHFHRKYGCSGRAIICLTIDVDGSVNDVIVQEGECVLHTDEYKIDASRIGSQRTSTNSSKFDRYEAPLSKNTHSTSIVLDSQQKKQSAISRDIIQEIQDTFKKMPKWKPARLDGKPVKSHFITLFSFYKSSNKYPVSITQ